MVTSIYTSTKQVNIMHKLTYCILYCPCRIPEGPVDQGPATGRVHALEEQLIKAKEQIENYKRQTGDGWYMNIFPSRMETPFQKCVFCKL